MANASPSSTPNPDATKFTLDTTLPEMFNVANADVAAGNQFAEAVFAAGGVVASIFGVNDFVTAARTSAEPLPDRAGRQRREPRLGRVGW